MKHCTESIALYLTVTCCSLFSIRMNRFFFLLRVSKHNVHVHLCMCVWVCVYNRNQDQYSMNELVVKTNFFQYNCWKRESHHLLLSWTSDTINMKHLISELAQMDPLISHHLPNSVSLKLCPVHSAWPAKHLSDWQQRDPSFLGH